MNEAELVYSHVLKCNRLSLYLNKDSRLDKNESARIGRILKRRIRGEPLQYILGMVEFMGLEFKVDKRALIPRPETEILVDSALERLKLRTKNIRPAILDLGTGSGCIAVTIAKLLPQAEVYATDISVSALRLARENADLYKVKVKFLRSDIFSALSKQRKKFDLIISNPPYISSGDISGLAKEISFEPRLALEAGKEGLDFYARIITQAPGYLKTEGLLALELGANQARRVCAMYGKEKFNAVELIKDYNNIERVVIAKQGT